jgi:3-oxoacyl-[acyl-carrier-protein] synthase-1
MDGQRVVITGIGIHSCLGTSLDEVHDSLCNGKSGIVNEQRRVDKGFQSPLTGSVPVPN